MSAIPSSAMPHAFVQEDDDPSATERVENQGTPSRGLLIGGAAVAAYLLYKVLR
ncbi:hypothetical protein [Altererythrobacter sp. TH136]|uniref:hypothetical protein n=1 Tax=Altererythrobacter sp. TH136 TaxID=2067415 RepID=UPI00143D968E|nr:hypothetical protein [Altererythrobacter sp. TH136]